MLDTKHTEEVVATYQQILAESAVEARFIEIGSGRRIHLIESGTGPPLVILHGTGGAAYTTLPFIEPLKGVRAIALDLPGNGLSDPIEVGRKSYHDFAVEILDQVLDALELNQISLAGASGGGLWSIWYALTRPERVERLILLTGIPALPGTSAPLPLRLMGTPIIGDIIARLPANEKTIINIMGVVGEKRTIVDYPHIIEALAAANNDPVASKANQAEMSAIVNLFGWKSEMKIGKAELGRLAMPTLLIWGERDPVGGAEVARAVHESVPDSRLELLPAGHAPWLGHPERTAELISEFVR